MRYTLLGLLLLLIAPSLLATDLSATFDLSDTATSYNLYEAIDGPDNDILLVSRSAPPLPFTTTKPEVYVYVRAVNSKGESKPSEIAYWSEYYEPVIIKIPPSVTGFTITVESN